MDRLTPRQQEVARLVSLGLNNEDIGTEMSIAVGSVANMLTEMYLRLEMDNINKNPRVLLARIVLLSERNNDSD